MLLSNAIMPYHGGLMNQDEKREYNRLYQIANRDRIAARREARRSGLGNNVRRCSVPGCDGIYDAKGYCARHYMAFRRNGDPTEVRQFQIHGKTLAERFAAYVERSDGCWEWCGARNPQGYGVLNVRDSARLAHRVSYELEYGKIPSGLNALHTCDNPCCVRPDHLFLGTLADNNADMDAKGRRGAPPSKLTAKAIQAIKGSSAKNIDLAKRFGVSETTIRAIRRYGQTWRPRK